MKLAKKSTELDPWAKDRGLAGYCKELRKEAEEVILAIENEDYENLKEELGDVLLDWSHACILAEKEGLFTVKDVIKGIEAKLDRRKPYLKQNKEISKGEAKTLWLEAKQKEKNQRK